jgi:NADH-quinone oxidoreductase subunit I
VLGQGIIKGLIETARNFAGSYVDPARLTTIQYPEETAPPKENARNFPFLVFDQDPDKGLRCVACTICEKECPPQCIYIVPERDEKGKALKKPKIFDIDLSVCMNCQICAEVCPFDAIKMDTKFDLSRLGRFEPLLAHKSDLAKPNEYYRQIHPTEAAEVDARLEAARVKQAARAAEAAAAKAAFAGGAGPAAPSPPLPSAAAPPKASAPSPAS